MLRGGSRSFWAASFFLPRRVRAPATALYAFCRAVDDLVDLDGGKDAITQVYRRVQGIYGGAPCDHPADRAFAGVVRQFSIPRALVDALVEGFEWDASDRRYETLADLRGYGARVAGTVGAMMTLIMGVRSRAALARACDLGVAMQLTNIARDVGEDARAGRLYLPRSWLREAGIDPEQWLARPAHGHALASVVARLLREADALYVRAEAGVAALPPDCRPGIRAARLLYSAIGHEVGRRGYDSVSSRAVVPTARKLELLAQSHAAPAGGDAGYMLPPLDEVRFLVDAVPAEHDESPLETAMPPWWDLPGRFARMVEIFESLERRESMQRGLAR